MGTLTIGNIVELKEFDHRRFLLTKKTEGGFGIVYFLQSLSNIPNCVMKTYKNQVSKEDIEKESFAWAQLGKHKNIAAFLCYGTIDNIPYVLSERYPNTLEDLIENPKTTEEVKVIFNDVVSGLNYAKKKLNLVHRDIKPNNIFIDKNGIPKIGDFGLAVYEKFEYKLDTNFKSYTKYSSKTEGDFGGTLPFIAPELFGTSNFSFTTSTDIYALGITFFLLFSEGLLPYDIKEHVIFQNAFERFSMNCKDLEFKNIILKCIELNPQKRFSEYNEFFIEDNDNPPDYELAEVINTIQLLRREKKTEQALEYAKEKLREKPANPLLINQLALVYNDKKDEKTFEFVLSDYLDNVKIEYDFTMYY
ncbi:MAG: protein kinase, partial [Treponema sp.]|nr:protein kinase [Candidatus Treponema caballi]